MTAVSTRTGTYASIVAGLTDVMEQVATAWAVASGEAIELAGFRAQTVHVPPAAWMDMSPTSTDTESGGRITDRLPFELWFALAPGETEGQEMNRLAALVDVAIPIVDVAISRHDARALFGVDRVNRQGFSFRSSTTAQTAGDPGDLPCLVIPLAVQWMATVC